jgi:hypothetical protein
MTEGAPWKFEPVYSKRSILNTSRCTNSKSYQHILLLVYYKKYNVRGPSDVKNPIYSNNPYIGRVDANDIPPPHTVISLVEFMCQGGEGLRRQLN